MSPQQSNDGVLNGLWEALLTLARQADDALARGDTKAAYALIEEAYRALDEASTLAVLMTREVVA